MAPQLLWFCLWCGSGNKLDDLKCQGCSHPITEGVVYKQHPPTPEAILWIDGTYIGEAQKLNEAFCQLGEAISDAVVPVMDVFAKTLSSIGEIMAESMDAEIMFGELGKALEEKGGDQHPSCRCIALPVE